MAGANREPSSFVQSMSITGRSVCDVVLVEGAQHFQGAHHAEDAIEAATLGLGVDVRAGHHRRQAVVLPGPPAEDVAHLIDRDVEPRLLEPGHEEAPCLLVLGGEGESLHAATRRRADLGHPLEAAPEALPVHPQPGWVHARRSFVRDVISRSRPHADPASAGD